MKRTVEMAICYSDETWRAEFFVEIEDIEPGGEAERYVPETTLLEILGIQALEEQLAAGYATCPRPKDAPEIVKIFLYNSMDDEVEPE